MTHLHPSYEPHRLGRLAGAVLGAAPVLPFIDWGWWL